MVNFDFAKRLGTYAGSQLYQLSSAVASLPIQNQQAIHEEAIVPPASTEYLVHNWLEAQFNWFQRVILWHDPFYSLWAISGLWAAFHLLTYFAPSFYSTIMIAIFVYNFNKVWFRYIWPEIRVPPQAEREEESRLDVDRWTHLHPQLMTLNELHLLASNLTNISKHHLQNLLALRSEKHVTFCLLICSTLSCTAFIGNRISGSTMIFWITSFLITAPGIYLYLLPNAVKEYLSKIIRSSAVFQGTQTVPTSLSPSPLSSTPPISSSSSINTLLDHLKQYSISLKESALEKNLTKPDHLATEVPSKEKTASTEFKEEETNPVSDPLEGPRRGSDDLSSTESTSLIDLDEDQQDGFVML